MTQKFFPFLPLLLIVLGCQHSPSPTGLDALPDADLVGVLSFDSQRDSALVTSATKLHAVTGAGSQFLSVGRTTEYTCSSLIRWIEFPSTTNLGGRIVSATLTLYATPYGIGDRGAPLAFNVREVSSYWSSHSLTADSIRAGTIVASPDAKGRFSGVVGDSVVIPLDTTMVRNWLRLMADGKYTDIRGILLDPDAGSTSIRAFESNDPRPSSASANPRGPKLTLVMDFGAGLDTTYPTSVEDTYITMTSGAQPTGLVVAGAISYRGMLVFDVSRIPAGSIINNAALYLSLDESTSRRAYRAIDSVYVYESLSAEKDSLAAYPVAARKIETGRWKAQGGLALPLVRAVQRWVIDPKQNHGLVLVKAEESSDIDYLVFHGPAAAEDKKPRLVVTYSQRP